MNSGRGRRVFLRSACALAFVLVFAFAANHSRAQQTSPLLAILSDINHPAWNDAWQPNGTLLATAFGNDVRLYTADNWQTFTTLQGHTGTVYDLAWNPSGTILASGGADKTVRFWDVKTRSTVKVIGGFKNPIFGLWWSPDGSKLAVSFVDHLITGSNEAYVFVTISLWDVTEPTSPYFIYQLPSLPEFGGLAWSANSSKLIIANTGLSFSTLSIWRVSDGQLQSTSGYAIYQNPINEIERKPNSDIIAIASDLEEVDLWDPTQDQYLLTFQGNTNQLVMSAAWSPDGTRLASADEGGTIQVWDAATAALLATFKDATAVNGVLWSSDGTKLASINNDAILKIWDVSHLLPVNDAPTATFYPTVTPFPLGTATPVYSPWS